MPISRREKKIKKLSVRFWISDKIRPREEITRWNICSNFESFKTKFERTEELRNEYIKQRNARGVTLFIDSENKDLKRLIRYLIGKKINISYLYLYKENETISRFIKLINEDLTLDMNVKKFKQQDILELIQNENI